MERWLTQFAEIEASLPGASQAWVRDARKQGIRHFQQTGLPTLRDEAWKYTSVAAITKRDYLLADQARYDLTSSDLEAFRFTGLETCERVFVNGHYCPDLSCKGEIPAGMMIENIAASLEKGGQPLTLQAGDNVFASLNNAFMSDGLILQLADNTVVEKPVHLLFVSTESEQPVMIYPRVEIRLGVNSKVTLIEHYVSHGAAKNLTNALTNIVAGENSQIEYYRLQDESLDAYHIANVFIDQKQDSKVTSHSISLGAALARVDIVVKLAAEKAETKLNGLFMGQGRQHTDHHLLVDHLSPHTRSDQYFKGVLNNASRGVFNGKVIVHEGAQKIESNQVNRNLLLSANAEIDTKPELEIYADDVKCAHGATIGQLSETELFYLQSRGIDEEKARSILTYAFADDVISRMRLGPVQDYLEQKVVGQLSGAGQHIDDIRELV